jgi:hypothetical protein
VYFESSKINEKNQIKSVSVSFIIQEQGTQKLNTSKMQQMLVL